MKPKIQKLGRFYGIGVGPGDPELMTLKAARILAEVPVIFVPKKGEESASYARAIIASLVEGKEVVELVFPMLRDREQLADYWHQAAESIWQRLEQGEDCAFVNLGDPVLYGTLIYVLDTLQKRHTEVEVEIIPGVSSINAAAARAMLPLAINDERMAIVSGRCEDSFIKETLGNFDTVIFLKVNAVFDRLFGILGELDLVKNCVYVEKCTTKDEKIVTDISQLRGRKLDYFSLLIVRR